MFAKRYKKRAFELLQRASNHLPGSFQRSATVFVIPLAGTPDPGLEGENRLLRGHFLVYTIPSVLQRRWCGPGVLFIPEPETDKMPSFQMIMLVS